MLSFFGNTGSSPIAVSVGEMPLPFPDEHVISTDVTANGASTEFTINEAGTYSIACQIASYGLLPLQSSIQINGVAHPLSIYRNVTPNRLFKTTIAAALAVGDVVSLVLTSSTAGTLHIAPTRGGATLTIIRIPESGGGVV